MRAPARWWIAFGGVLAVATALRVARLGWGLAENGHFPDEGAWLPLFREFATIRVASFDPAKLTYPTLYLYLSGLAAHGAAALGWVTPLDDTKTLAPLLVARAVSAAAAVATVGVVAALGRAMLGPWLGLAAAAFIAVTPLAVMQPYYVSVDSLLVLCAALTLLASWRVMTQGSIASAFLAGGAVGLSFATKYTGLAFLSAVLWAIAERAWQQRSPAVLGRLGMAAALGVTAAILLGCPPCVLRPDRLREAFAAHRFTMAVAQFAGNTIAPSIGWWGRPFLQQGFAVLPYMLGLPLYLLAVGGLVVAARSRGPADRLLLASIVPYFAYMGTSLVVFPRYMLPLAPGLAILAARGLDVARARPAAQAAIAMVIFAYGLALSASQVRTRFTWDQQRTVAAWLDTHTAPDAAARVVAVPFFFDYFRLYQPLTGAGFRVQPREPGKWFEGPPPILVVPDWYATAIRRDQRDPKLLAGLEALESGAAGFRPVFHLSPPPYLQQGLDVRLDPAFAVDLWQGTLGFTVYARNGAVQP